MNPATRGLIACAGLFTLLAGVPGLAAGAGPLEESAHLALSLSKEVEKPLSPASGRRCPETAVKRSQGFHGFICGGLDLQHKDIPFIQDFLNRFGLGAPVNKRVNCGLPMEHFEVCSSCSDEITPDMMEVIRPMLADSRHRQWHEDWHDMFLIAPQVQLLRKHPTAPRPNEATSARLSAHGYLPDDLSDFIEHHSGRTDIDGKLAGDQDVFGEDFLFMHREMIKMVQLQLAYAGKACIRGFHPLPATADDPKWPAPRASSDAPPYMKAEVEDYLQQARDWDRKLRDPSYLRSVSLSQLGSDISRHPHALLHNVYENRKDQCRGPRDAHDVSESCDDLIPPWSSLVNRHFWKIHGYVDDFIGLWMQQHPEYTEIAVDCGGRQGCYTWKGTWIGHP